MIEIKNLSFSYIPSVADGTVPTGDFTGKTVLSNLSLSMPDAGTVLLTGESGCGKTTLLHILAGLLIPDSGRIDGLENHRVGAVFQEDRLLPWRTVWENAAIAGDKEKARKILTELGLGDVLNAYPRELSGGMSRRVAIARALTFSEDIVLLDEPFNGLDPAARENAMKLIRSYTKLRILSTHIESDYPFIAADARVTL